MIVCLCNNKKVVLIIETIEHSYKSNINTKINDLSYCLKKCRQKVRLTILAAGILRLKERVFP